jgi:LytS/YehU family sensor histidine kinase
MPRQLLQALIWGSYGTLSLWQFQRYAGDYSGLWFIAATLTLGLWAGSESLRALALRRQWLRRSGLALAWRLLGAVAAVSAGIQLAIAVLLFAGLAMGLLTMPGGKADYRVETTIWYWVNTALMLGFWLAIWVGVAARRHARDNELARLRAESARRGLELEALRARLNPHFVFNALNNVRALINEDPARARELVTRLSNTLRHALQHSQRDRVRLDEEWAVMQDYLAVEAVHFEQRLRVELRCHPDCAAVELPPMLLQGLVENAIKHGIARSPGGGLLRVIAEPLGAGLRIIVENSGQLEAPTAQATGVGLAWLRQRLEGRQPAARFALIQADPQSVRATLELPA